MPHKMIEEGYGRNMTAKLHERIFENCFESDMLFPKSGRYVCVMDSCSILCSSLAQSLIFAEFLIWKKNEEDRTCSRFVKRCGNKNINGCELRYCICHRSSELNIKSKRIRRAEVEDSYRIGGGCLASISVKVRTYRRDAEKVVVDDEENYNLPKLRVVLIKRNI